MAEIDIPRTAFGRKLCMACLGLLLIPASELRAEQYTLSTYYPAPSGAYVNMITTQNTYLARDGGAVGVGTTTPLYKLHAESGGDVSLGDHEIFAARGDFGFNPTYAGVSLGYRSDGTWATGGIIRSLDTLPLMIGDTPHPHALTVSAGKVGVGTSNPSTLLDIEGSAFVNSSLGNLNIGYPGIANHWEVGTLNGGLDLTFVALPGGAGAFNAVTFTGGGNVGIGTVNPQGVYNFGPTLDVNGESCGTSGYGDLICIGGDDAGGDGEVDMVSAARNRLGFWNPTQGTHLDLYANSFNVSSSRRFKENIRPIDNALQKVTRLSGVAFDWKATKQPSLGLIAEDVGKVFPELVTYEDNGSDARAVDYSKLVPVLIEAVKQQQAEIDQLNGELKKLKSK